VRDNVILPPTASGDDAGARFVSTDGVRYSTSHIEASALANEIPEESANEGDLCTSCSGNVEEVSCDEAAHLRI
jgi:uncharacterized protein with PIN domain